MGVLDEAVEIPRKTMVMFYLVDTSGSMDGAKIGALNDAMADIIPDLRDISDDNPDAKIKIAVLQFSSGTQWLTPSPEELGNYNWTDLQAGGVTDLGEACQELNSKLDRNAFLQDAVGNYAPVIILMSDGDPTDEYQSKLNALKKNKWFKSAIKVALAIGSDVNHDVLAEFTGNKELVVPIDNKAMMKKLIKFVSVTSSKIGSKKAGDSGTETKQDEVAEAIKEEMKDVDPEDEVSEGW